MSRRIRDAIEARRVYDARVAEAAGISSGALSRLLDGGGTREVTLDRIADFLGTTRVWLEREEGEAPAGVSGSRADAEVASLEEAEDRQGGASGRARRRRA